MAAAVRAEAPAAAAPELKIVKTIVGGGEGGWDFAAADQEGKLAYVARSNRFMVFDIEQGKVTGELADTPGAHGAVVLPKLNLGFATCGKDDTVAVFDLKTLKTTKKIKVGSKPDAIMYDPATEKVVAVGHGDGSLYFIDPKALDKEPVKLDLAGGKLEVAVADGAGHIYANSEDKNEIIQVDSKAMKVLAHWPLKGGEGPTGLAIDVAKKRLYTGCANNKVLVVDAEKGTVLAEVAAGPGIDGVSFDATLGVAISANGGNGTATIIREDPAGKFTAVQTLKTFKTARTVDVDAKTHQFYMPCNIVGDDGKTSFGLIVIGAAK
jgi:DNA-binding beta-propeller fold protein YncE